MTNTIISKLNGIYVKGPWKLISLRKKNKTIQYGPDYLFDYKKDYNITR